MELLPFEGSFAYMEEAATTKLFFFPPLPVDTMSVETALRARLLDIAKVNPWILATIVTNKGKPHLAVPSSAAVTASVVGEVFSRTSLPDVSTTTPYTDLAKHSTKHFALKTASQRKNKPTRVTKFTLNENSKGVTLAVSMCHVAGDGYTFFRLIDMIDPANEITPLTAKRNLTVGGEVHNAGGGKREKDMLLLDLTGGNWALTCNMIGGMMCGKTTRALSYYVDADKVTQEKREVVGRGTARFVSTNDILVSTHGKAFENRILLMAINWRERRELPGLGSDLAGNYEGCLVFDPPSYRCPSSIRKTLESPQRPKIRVDGIPIPGTCEQFSLKYGLCTNWAFKYTLHLPGAESVDYALALPLYDINEGTGGIDISIVYYAQPGRLAVLYISPNATDERVKGVSGSVLGEVVGRGVFD